MTHDSAITAAPGALGTVEFLHIPDHTLLRPIAAGAYGEVWLARNVVGTPRAVKIVRRDRHATAESFEREFKGLQKFEPVSRAHQGLVDILTLGPLPEGAGFYYIMELADNLAPAHPHENTARNASSAPGFLTFEPNTYQPHTLRADLNTRGALPANEVIALGLRLTDALAHLHAHGLVHRDVKPSNILFIGGEPKLADAGLVAALDDARSLVGTAGYIAPEGPGTPQADLYALGKVLYEAAFGKDRSEFPALPANITSRPDHPQLLELNAILLRACATDYRERYCSADQMKYDLALVQRGKPVRHSCLWHMARRRSTKAVLVILMVLASVAAWLRWANRNSLSPAVRNPSEGYAYGSTPTTNATAWEAFMTAETFCRSNIRAQVGHASVHAERAVALDPAWSEAHCLVAAVASYQISLGLIRGKEGCERWESAARHASALAPNSIWPRRLLTNHRIYARYEWVEAEPELLEYIRLEPHIEATYSSYGTLLSCLGRHEEAIRQTRRAIDMSPADDGLRFNFGFRLLCARRFTEALAQLEKPLIAASTLPYAQVLHTLSLEFAGHPNEAMQKGERLYLETPHDIDVLALAGFLYARRGRLHETHLVLEQIDAIDDDFRRPFAAAVVLANANQTEGALAGLERCLEDRLSQMVTLAVDPRFDALRHEPRFAMLLERMRLHQVPGAIPR